MQIVSRLFYVTRTSSDILMELMSLKCDACPCICFVTDLSATLTITGAANNSDVTVNDGPVVLVCHADGHPSPTYRWLDISSGEATDGSQYTITTSGEYSLECTASNDVTFADGRIVPHSVSARFYVNGMCLSLSLCEHSTEVLYRFVSCNCIHNLKTVQNPDNKCIRNSVTFDPCALNDDTDLHKALIVSKYSSRRTF